jgi:hypothetical protein
VTEPAETPAQVMAAGVLAALDRQRMARKGRAPEGRQLVVVGQGLWNDLRRDSAVCGHGASAVGWHWSRAAQELTVWDLPVVLGEVGPRRWLLVEQVAEGSA